MTDLIQQWIIDLYSLATNKARVSDSTPTPSSIAAIESSLGFKLPQSTIEFASRCLTYESWFVGLGEDTSSPNHIIETNNLFHESSEDGWIPPWLIMIDSGHDGHCHGFDSRSREAGTGEYKIYYWNYDDGRDFTPGESFEDYSSFVSSLVLRWAQWHYDNRNRRGRLRTESREIVPKIDSILAGIEQDKCVI